MKKIYLDNNIIIDVKNQREQSIFDTINNLDKNHYQIVYGPAHIEEIAVTTMHHGKSDSSAAEKLTYLGKLTDSIELLPYFKAGLKMLQHDGIYIYKEHPKRCFGRVISDYGVNEIAEKLQKKKLAAGEAFEKMTNVTSLHTNSIDIQKEIDNAKPRIHYVLLECYKYLKSDERLDDYLPSSPPGCDDLNFRYARKYFPIHELLVEKIFEFLELRRYFPDDAEKYINSLHDATHAVYAAYCDVFVTNDRNFRQKTKAAYAWLGVETIVLSRKEFVAHMANKAD